MSIFLAVLSVLGGLALSVALSVAFSIALELLMSIGKLHAVMGGFGAFILVPANFVCSLLVLLGYSLLTGISNGMLFFTPLASTCAFFGGLAAIFLGVKFTKWVTGN